MDFFHTSFAFKFCSNFFFFKMQSKIGVRIILGRVLYTGKYGSDDALVCVVIGSGKSNVIGCEDGQ